MISWELIGYKFLLIARFIQILFLDGYRPSDEYSSLVEKYIRIPGNNGNHSSFTASNSTIIRTHFFPLVFGETLSLFITAISLHLKNHPPFAWISPILSPYFIIRFISFLFSLMIDFFLFRIAKCWRVKPNLVIFLYSSSYIPWTYFTYTRSSLLETVLFVLFLYLIVLSTDFNPENENDQRNFSAITHGHHGHSHGNCSDNRTIEESSSTTTIKQALLLGFIFACGISNRLNFVVFCLAPLIQWFLTSGRAEFVAFCGRLCQKLHGFLMGLILGLLIISAIDSALIGRFHIDRLPRIDEFFDIKFVFNLITENFTCAVWNSLRDELSFANIANRSVHPWYSHIFFNIPLEFGVFGILCILYFLQCFHLDVVWYFGYINFRYWFLLSSFIVPSISLSIYPTKNSEDLCPLLIPLLLVIVIRISQYAARLQARLILAWCAWNFFGLLYYGGLYNAGLIKSINELIRIRLDLQSSNQTFAYHFFATEQPSSIAWYTIEEFSSDKAMQIQNMTIFHYKKNDRAKFQRRLKYSFTKFTHVFVVAPGTVSLCDVWSNKGEMIGRQHWHYSSDAPPNVWYVLGCSTDDNDNHGNIQQLKNVEDNCRVSCMENKWNQVYQLLTLRVYRFR